MFKQLQTLIPGFEISADSPLPHSKPSPSHMKQALTFSVDLRLLIEESNTAGGEFVVCSVLELFLRQSQKVVFVGAQNSFSHYEAILKKLVSFDSSLTCRASIWRSRLPPGSFNTSTSSRRPLTTTPSKTFLSRWLCRTRSARSCRPSCRSNRSL